MIDFDKLWDLKLQRISCFEKFITAKVKQDVTMHVWNGKHPVDGNMSEHVCKAGTVVRVWMVSRFGDVGITDNFENARGYDLRVEPEMLEDLQIKEPKRCAFDGCERVIFEPDVYCDDHSSVARRTLKVEKLESQDE